MVEMSDKSHRNGSGGVEMPYKSHSPASEDPAGHSSPFHPGEEAIQERLGRRAKLALLGSRVIRDHMPEQHRAFFAELPFLVAGSVDGEGRPWASLLSGRPGFLSSPDARHLTLDARPAAGDPLAEALRPGRTLGLLGLDFATRRRNRLNVRIEDTAGGRLNLAVDQSFGNCPKYIQARDAVFVRDPAMPAPAAAVERFDRLDEKAHALIAAADTLFVASAAADARSGDADKSRNGGGNDGVDVSHRGGRPGFVKLGKRPAGGPAGNGISDNETPDTEPAGDETAEDLLTIPDYSGNFFFNTLGNFLINPKAGLTFVDFESGDLLMLSGRVVILWDGPEVAALEGAERAWRFTLDHGLWLRSALPLRWRFREASPHNPPGGSQA